MNWYIRLLLAATFLVIACAGAAIGASDSVRIARLDFENADIRQVMKTLSDIGDRNIIVDSEVEGELTIYLQDITWKEALVAVLKMHDLVAYEDLGLIKVLSREKFETQQQTYHDQRQQQRMEQRIEEGVQVQVIKIHNGRAEDIKNTLDPILGERDQPSVDIRSNSLVFTASDSSLAVIREIIRELDTETRQVAIEVKMVTVDAGSLSELGVNWSAVRNGNSATQNSIITEDKNLVMTYGTTLAETALEATIATLVDKNQAEIVSKPHVTTQDNEAATIRSGQQVPIVTYDEARNTVIELVDAATELTVTPHILADDRILLDILAQRRSAEGVGVGLKINEERADIRMITSNGETAVIAGMRQTQDSQQDSGIPILQDIPLIGQIFKYTKRQNKQTDLIVFITPRIVTNAGMLYE